MRQMEFYKASAIGSLIVLDNSGLKGLLRRVVAKVFNDFEIMGCCNDPQTRHDDGRQDGRTPAG